MRRMLSGLLATAMVASVCATATFAASTAEATGARIAIDFDGFTGNEVAAPLADKAQLTITVTLPEGGDITFTCIAPDTANGEAKPGTDDGWAEYFAKNAKWEVSSNAKFGNGANMKNNDLSLERGTDLVQLVTKVAGKDVAFTKDNAQENKANNEAAVNAAINVVGWAPLAGKVTYKAPDVGVGTDADVTTTDKITASIRDIIVCDEDGQPLPLTEDRNGVGRDQNDGDGVQSGETVYFMIRDDMEWKFHDDTFWKLKISKGDNGKYISEIKDITKTFGDDLYSVYTHTQVPGTGGTRARYIKVKMNEIMTDDEFKVTLDMRLTARSKAVDVFGSNNINDDEELKVDDFYFYVQNITKRADGEWKVGTGGMMLDPVKNDWNEVTYIDEDKDVAFMKFFGDSSTDKFYAKLSTRWEHADYASYFNDQDAYIFQFTGSPSLSSTSRADLQLYSPFVDEDGNETFDPEQAVIYQVVDGDLFDITDNFTYEEGENGDMAYCTRVRFLGTFIICQKPVDEASNDDVVDLVPDDVVPDNNAGAPVDVTPGNTNNGGNGGKAPANTGKF